ncbi:hexokinase [Colletotrichum plurivorum]|uniref:Hexokinase n=1 Tax=Colletotrichum plurivorum TaxID=2175906 RepID=A0A8H6NLR1_9PEZI|nr:hexokinase [Colletotrichum plurivorum]
MSEFAVEDMDFNGADNDAGAYDYDMDAIDKEDEVVLTLGSGSGSGSGGGKAGSRQVYGATPAPGSRSAPGPRHRRRRSSFLVSHGVSSFWYGLCSVALLVIVLVSPRSLVFLYLSSPISLNDPSVHPSSFCITNYPSTSWHEHFHTIPH